MIQSIVVRARKAALPIIIGLAFAALSACAGGSGRTTTTSLPQTEAALLPADANLDYRLGSGDKLRVIVFGEQDLSGEFDVTGSGKVSLPLIGQVQAAGKTLNEFAQEVGNELKQGYLTNPKISVEVLNYRPFYIIGEVDKPGQYPYTNGMTALNAIAVAGGFTYRANHDRIFITRGDATEAEHPANQSVRVLPGDIVRVPERFF